MNHISTLFLTFSGESRPRAVILSILIFLPNLIWAQNVYDFSKLIDLSNRLNAARLKVSKDTSWHKAELGANFNQGAFSDNWTGGGVNSAGVGVFLNAVSENRAGKNSWRNDLQAQYGILKNKGQGSRKNQDRIFFDTKYSRELHPKWILFTNLNFQSQFANGYYYSMINDTIPVRRKSSTLFAPAYLTQSLGFEFKPDPYFFLDVAPGAFRQTIVWDKSLYINTPEQKNYGVPIGKRIGYEVALMQIVANYNRDIAKQMNLKFRYQLYSNILNPLKIDNRLDASLTARINKYINVNLSAIVAYNEDQSDNIQLAQGLNVGFLYTF